MAATAPSLPRVLGRYALYDAIASGGMATVHFGRLLGPVGFARTVAIKRLHAQFARDPEFVSMFLDEARLAARIRHPNVVPTLDVVALEGELFLVMDYVQGESFGHLLKTTRKLGLQVPLAHTASIIAGALHGLHAAHEARGERGGPLGIVHRDVSPQNILVGVDGVARVLDFGVAKAAGRIQTTRDGQLKGKMAYMSPEQIRGTGVDRRTDIYAAGVVLWEALAGRRLFKGQTDVEVFGKVLEGKVAAPSQFNPGVPAAVDAIVLRAVAGSPDQRFGSAREMARALEAVVPLVAAAEIGEWVEHTGADGLRIRTETVGRIEADSSHSIVPPHAATREPAPATSSSSSAVQAIQSSERSEVSKSMSDQLSASIPKVDRRVVLALAGVGAVLLVLIVRALLGGSTATPVTPHAPAVESSFATAQVPPVPAANGDDSKPSDLLPPPPGTSAPPRAVTPPASHFRPQLSPRSTAHPLDGVLNSRE